MNRRRFLHSAVAGGAVVGVGALLWLRPWTRHDGLTIDAALRRLDRLDGVPLVASGPWQPQQVFTHCAQSVEYSLTGYPQNKSAAFRNTVGKLAFSAFATRGEMVHPLDEPIPGAPALDPQVAVARSLARLRTALSEFNAYQGPLAPHFAYGRLDKAQFTVAHVLHLDSHLGELRASA